MNLDPENPHSKALRTAVLAILRPLVRILIRNGVAFNTFAEFSKKMYVDVAFAEFGETGRKQTISRVSALTGLTRKETRRLHELGDAGDLGASQKYNRAIRVISGWVTDRSFQDGNGAPRELPVEGEPSSFSALCKKYSGDIPTQAMLAVLCAANSVEKNDDRVRLIRQAYLPGNDPVEKLRILGADVAELIATIDHNITSTPEQRYFQRKVSYSNISESARRGFKAMSAEKAQALLEELNLYLSNHEDNTDTENTHCHDVSLGIYYFENTQACHEDAQ